MVITPTQPLLVDSTSGMVSRKIFADSELYERERDCIFRRCWLFVGHDSMLPKPGDFISNYMGEDPVIVWRGRSGQPRVFLNTCPHRGNKLCLFDRGNAPALTCSYHGWTFNTEGALTGVPFERLAYDDALEHEANGLKSAKVATYGGMIFASWDPHVPSLDDYLGEMRWWLDVFVGHQDFGGMQYIPSAQKYRMPGNWKLTADNFIGDFYHVPVTHASFLRLFDRGGEERHRSTPTGSFSFFLEPAHGLGSVRTDDRLLERDLSMAEQFGPEAVDWVKERTARLKARVAGPAKPDGFGAGAAFPNLTFQGTGAFEGKLVALAQPRGPHSHEVWQWLLFERDAPKVVRQYAAAWTARRQSAAGLVGSDDGENFERIAENTRSPMTSELRFHNGMSIRRDTDGLDVGGTSRDDWHIQGLPGTPSRTHFSEVNQRGFYRYWARQMGLEGAPA